MKYDCGGTYARGHMVLYRAGRFDQNPSGLLGTPSGGQGAPGAQVAIWAKSSAQYERTSDFIDAK